MKKYSISGFKNYEVRKENDQTSVIDLATGEAVSVNAKGNVRLVADEDAPAPYKAGQGNTFTMESLSADTNDWTEVSNDTKPLSEADAAKKAAAEAFKAHRKDLKRKADEIFNAAMKETDQAKKMQLSAEYMEAMAALEALKPVKASREVTPAREYNDDEKALIQTYEDMKVVLAAKIEEVKTLREDIKNAILPDGYKRGALGGGEMPQKGRHVGYEMAQEIRKAYSEQPEGEKNVSAIATQFSCSPSAVLRYVNYLQFKLKTGDTAYTPLINAYYPADLWPNGAPLAEDAPSETNDHYKLPAKRDARNPKALSSVAKELGLNDAPDTDENGGE